MCSSISRSQHTMSFSCTCHRTRIVSVGFVTKPSRNDDGATGSQWKPSYGSKRGALYQNEYKDLDHIPTVTGGFGTPKLHV